MNHVTCVFCGATDKAEVKGLGVTFPYERAKLGEELPGAMLDQDHRIVVRTEDAVDFLREDVGELLGCDHA